MTNTTSTAQAAQENHTLAEVAGVLRDAQKVLVATHENPDGDAIGSARAMELILGRIGVPDVLVYVPKACVPLEYETIRPGSVLDAPPADIGERLVVCVDCGNESRIANPDLLGAAADVVNIDHHADNTRYGRLNHVDGLASSTAEILYRLVGELGISLDAPLATALYMGLVTDTGRFQYSNTTADSLRMAADLVANGVDVHEIFRLVYERIEYPRLKLLARGLDRAQRTYDDRIVSTHLTRDDFDVAGANDDSAEGIVDFLRGVEGAMLAVMVRDLKPGSKFARKGSLRTTRDDVDVSIIARSYAGGGHRQAAGFTTDDEMPQILERVREHLEQQLDATS